MILALKSVPLLFLFLKRIAPWLIQLHNLEIYMLSLTLNSSLPPTFNWPPNAVYCFINTSWKTYAALPLLPSPPYFELPSRISNFPTQIATTLECFQSIFHTAFTYSFIHPSTQQVCGENLPRAKHSPRYKENISE